MTSGRGQPTLGLHLGEIHAHDSALRRRVQPTAGAEIAVTRGDRRARLELEKPTADMTVVTAGFLAGERAIAIRAAGDAEIDRLDAIADQIEAAIAAGDQDARDRLADELQTANQRLTAPWRRGPQSSPMATSSM